MTSLDNRLAPAEPRTDWKGSWIWAEPVKTGRNVYAMFRREFVAEESGTLCVDITADSFYWLYFDGELISRGPSRANLAYYTFDSFQLNAEPGRHVVAVLVHHIGQENATVMVGRPGLLADIELVGERKALDLSTGNFWKCQRSWAWKQDLPEQMSHFGFPEVLDLQKLPEGWNGLLFHDADWSDASVVGHPPCEPWTRLIPRDIAQLELENRASEPVAFGSFTEGREDAPVPSNQAAVRIRTRREGKAIFPARLQSGDYLTVDFGRVVSGYPVLVFFGSTAGQIIDLSYDDMLTEAGAASPERTYARWTDRYTLAGGRTEIKTAHPRGFRYLTIDALPGGGPVVIENVFAVEETYPFETQESFSSSDEQLDEFFVRGARTVKISSQDAFLDNPIRERVQWMEDLYLHNRVAAFAFGNMDLSRRAIFQGAQGALADGRINGFFPTDRTNLGFASSSICWLMVLVDYWLHTGRDDIRSVFPEARAVIDVFRAHTDERGLIATWPASQYWEWAPLGEGGCIIETNAALAMALDRLASHEIFVDALGDLTPWADAVRKSVHKWFWNPERELYMGQVEPDGSQWPVATQDGNILATLSGVCPREMRRGLLKRITDPANLGPVPIGENADKPADLTTSGKIVPVGTLWFGHFLCSALFENGMDQEALDQMRMLWGAYPDLQTFPETRIPHGNIVTCQGWGGGTAFLLPAYVLGVQPTARGWSEVDFAPHPCDLDHACGVFQTPKGTLGAYWSREEAGHKLSLDVPRGMQVHVKLGGAEEAVGAGHWEGII